MARKHEIAVARKLGGWRQPFSGAKVERRGDIQLPGYLVEEKETSKKSFRLTCDILKKIEWEAISNGKKPLIVMDIGGQEWACMRLKDMEELLNETN